jgi:SAM-dependent methyltransferase
MGEIYRVLKPGGVFICVDSLNNNPIYRFNRWLHYLCGERSLSTLKRMPSLRTIDSYRKNFGTIEVKFFGAIAWLTPLLSWFLGDNRTSNISYKLDKLLNTKRSAFKFVMAAHKDVQ